MKLKHPAVAGTLESSDCRVTVEPKDDDGIELTLESSVLAQFEDELTASILNTLEKLGVERLIVPYVHGYKRPFSDPLIRRKICRGGRKYD